MPDNRLSRMAALAILDDLDWHHRDDFVALADHVGPEVASRAYIGAVAKRNQQYRKDQEPYVQTLGGRSRIIDRFLKSLETSGIIQSKGRPNDREFRLFEVNGDPRFIPAHCPCCGPNELFIGLSGPNRYAVECPECGIKIERDTKPKAIRAWNRRNGLEKTISQLQSLPDKSIGDGVFENGSGI